MPSGGLILSLQLVAIIVPPLLEVLIGGRQVFSTAERSVYNCKQDCGTKKTSSLDRLWYCDAAQREGEEEEAL